MVSRWREANSCAPGYLLSVFIVAFTRGRQSYAWNLVFPEATSLTVNNKCDCRISNSIHPYTECRSYETWVSWVSNPGKHRGWMNVGYGRKSHWDRTKTPQNDSDFLCQARYLSWFFFFNWDFEISLLLGILHQDTVAVVKRKLENFYF